MAELGRRSAIESLPTIPPGQDVEIVGGQTISISRDVARYVQVKRCPSTEHP